MIDIEKMKFDLAVDSDLRRTIEELQLAFDTMKKENETSNSRLAKLANLDPSVVSKIINGRKQNVTLKTLITLYRALGRRFNTSSELLANCERRKANFIFAEEISETLPAASELDKYRNISTSERPKHHFRFKAENANNGLSNLVDGNV